MKAAVDTYAIASFLLGIDGFRDEVSVSGAK
jgi:hypothetical protein